MSDQQSNDVSPHSNGSAATISIVETNRLLPWLMFTAVLSGIAIAASIMTVIVVLQGNAYQMRQMQKTEMESRVTQERWNDLKVELAKRGIPTSDH